jgi:ATP-dependent Clp protease ATP-binding subunit ClpA
MSAQVIDNLTEQLKTLKLKQIQMELQQEEQVESFKAAGRAIADMRARVIMYRHLVDKSHDCIAQLAARLRNRTPDDLSSYPGDRAALLDADLMLSEIYRIFYSEQA